MNFKINLKPIPGAAYFTTLEYASKCSKMESVDEELKNSELGLRQLFNISAEFDFSISLNSEKANLSNIFDIIEILDDPVSGMNYLASKPSKSHGSSLLDLSFSFPKIKEVGWSPFDTLIIDSNAGLGISNGFLMIFNRNDSVEIKRLPEKQLLNEYKKEICVLSKVLDDLAEKGMDVLVRESNYKAAVLYQLIESSANLKPVTVKEKRSKTMIVADCENDFLSRIEKLGYELTSRENDGKARITIANYATQSRELIEMFADRVSAL